MAYTPYEWQNRLLKIYNGNGVIKAFAGTGKPYGTILLMKDRGYQNILVAVPTRKLKSQWTEELKKYGRKYNPPEYFFAVKIGDAECLSGILEFKDYVEIYLKNKAGEPIADEYYLITCLFCELSSSMVLDLSF